MKKSEGFTILEVVVALLILSLLSLSFIQVLLFLAITKNRALLLNNASLWAQGILESGGEVPPPQNNQQMLSCREDRIQLHQCDTEALFFLRITIEWEEENRDSSFVLHTLKREGVK